MRAIKNTYDDKGYVPGAGSFEINCYNSLQKYKDEVQGKVKLGIEAFAEAMLIIPKTLASNSGFDIQDSIINFIDEAKKKEANVGLDITNADNFINPETQGILDNYGVKKQFLNVAPLLAEQLLLVDEVS